MFGVLLLLLLFRGCIPLEYAEGKGEGMTARVEAGALERKMVERGKVRLRVSRESEEEGKSSAGACAQIFPYRDVGLRFEVLGNIN